VIFFEIVILFWRNQLNPPKNELEILDKFFRHLWSSDPILKDIVSYRKLHRGGMRYEIQNKELITPPKQFPFTIRIPIECVINYDLVRFSEIIYEYTTERIVHTHKSMYDHVSKVTELTGNVVDAAGTPINADSFLDMIEKLEISFDEDGKPILPSITADPKVVKKLSEIKFTKEQEERQNRIFETKKREFYAKKRYRRLSYI
jgi:hypothetical protein